MSISIGLVGLPSAGKSTLFNALLQKHQAEVAAFNFTTINPNIGIVEVPDPRLDLIAKIAQAKKTVYSTLKIFDIAGLIRGAHLGQGLGNQFLSEINRVDLIVIVVRFFENDNVPHPENNLHPGNDLKTVLSELILKDMETAENVIKRLENEKKSGDTKNDKKITVVKKISQALNNEIIPQISDEEKRLIPDIPFLTLKPFLFVANHSEAQNTEIDELVKKFCPEIDNNDWVLIDAQNEKQMIDFAKNEKAEIRQMLGIKPNTLEELLTKCFEKLDLINYFTAGEPEARAWKIKKGTNARQASCEIHNDFFQKFIRAEIVGYDDFVNLNGWQGAKSKGLTRIEGENYLVKDGDLINFIINK